MQKNEEFTCTIEDITEDGTGIGKVDGYIWFVKDAVVGDVALVRAMKMKKSYGYARLLQVLTPSPLRAETRCPLARACGGCQLQALRYEEQLLFKERKVKAKLTRIGGFKEEKLNFEGIIGMEDPWRYRNKAQFPVGQDKEGRVITGFYAGHTHRIVRVEDCLLGVPENREILEAVKEYMARAGVSAYDESRHEGLIRHVLIRKGFKSGEYMVCIVINARKLPKPGLLIDVLRKAAPVTAVSCSINMERTNVILGRETFSLFGPGYIKDSIGDIVYRISPLSFFQVNPVQTEKLYCTVLEYAGLTGKETVWDLYCGIGTISLFLARQAGQVYGVEIVPEAVRDAQENARLNRIANAAFYAGKAEEVLPALYKEKQIRADVIVTDPPRKGCDKACLETMLKMAPERIVYVSCDAATLARDLKILCDGAYQIERIRCVDMFPQTVHVETVCLLSKLRTTYKN